jgi:hypothetical protein
MDIPEIFARDGYAVLSGFLSAEASADLKAQISEVLEAAYPAGADDSGGNLYVPVSAVAASPMRSLNTMDGLREIIGKILGERDVVLKPPKVVSYRRASHWHRDCYNPHLRGVKIVHYVGGEQRFDVVPGSHSTATHRRTDHFEGRILDSSDASTQYAVSDYITVPVLEQDLLLFDISLLHRNVGDRGRFQWTVSALGSPSESVSAGEIAEYLADFAAKTRTYDTSRFPYLPPDFHTSSEWRPYYEPMMQNGVLSAFRKRNDGLR